MKIVKNLFLLVVISLLLQCAAYYYLNNVYFAEETNIEIKKVDSKLVKEGELNVKMPDDAKNIGISYNKKYVSFCDKQEILKIVDATTGEFKDIPSENQYKCASYKWLSDANIMIIAERVIEDEKTEIRFFSYDANKGTKTEIKDYINKKTNFILLRDKNANVYIDVSTLTGVMYAKITDGQSSSVHRIDRNESLTRISTGTNKIGNFKVVSHDDLYAYEDLDSKTIKTNAKMRTIKIGLNTKLSLLNADLNNNIYVGTVLNGVVDSIYYGKLSDKTSTWTNIKLPISVKAEDIIITPVGEIFEKSDANTLLNVNRGNKVAFTGRFIDIVDNMVLALENKKLVFTK